MNTTSNQGPTERMRFESARIPSALHVNNHRRPPPSDIGSSARAEPLGTGTQSVNATATATMTQTQTAQSPTEGEILRLTLAPRPSVRWDEGTVDNEGMGRKSSKRCCIFHKQREFGESSTDSSAEEDDESTGDDSDGGDKGDRKPKARRKIARPKQKVPDYQRFHA